MLGRVGLYLVTNDFRFSVILKVTIPLKATFNKRPELLFKEREVVQVMNAQTGSRSFGAVSWANAFLGCAD